MGEEQKKISFGFGKIIKKPQLVQTNQLAEKENSVQFIDCLEGKSIKLINGEAEKELPIIPMKTANSLRDNILESLRLRKEARKGKENGEKKGEDEIKEEHPMSLDQMAVKELIEDAKRLDGQVDEKESSEVILPTNLVAQKESTLDDYENMPVTDFGLAMLRGMGWDPKKGIGLNEKIVEPAAPEIRPKGMGLGADRSLFKQAVNVKGENLVMKKGAAVKIINGPYTDLYGRIEGFDELPGRLIVRLTVKNALINISEFMVQLVTTAEFNKNAKVMNLDKYNSLKDKQSNRSPSPKPRRKYSPSPPHNRKKYNSSDEDTKKKSSSKKHKKKHKKYDNEDRKSRAKRGRSPTPTKKHKRRHRSSS